MNLFRGDTGLLDSYHTYVEPQRALENTLNSQQRAIGGLQGQVEQNTSAITVERKSTARPTGTGGGFFNYLHYYQKSPTTSGARRH